MAKAIAAFAMFALFSPAIAAGGGIALPKAPIDDSDTESLQRGAALFVNYCMGCHSARHMSYGRLAEDLQISPQQLREHLIFGDAGLGEGMISAMSPEEAKAWFNDAPPPDLSLVARVRGVDWIYAYLRAFYRDDSRPSGWNNAIFENASMPHALAELQGVFARVEDENENENNNSGGDGYAIGKIQLKRISEGGMSAPEYDAAVADLSGFLFYIAEPSRRERLRVGYLVMAGLILTLVACYFLYREYWRDIS